MAPLRKLDALLCLAERSIALLDRCRPLNGVSESKRVCELWQQGQPQSPVWIYPYPPKLEPLRRQLSEVLPSLSRGDEIHSLYAERCCELELEASLAEAIGTPRFVDLARQRFAPHIKSHTAKEQAYVWARLRLTAEQSQRYRSDDALQPASLLGQMLAMVSRLKLPVGVVIKEDLQSVAAAGEDTLFVRPGVSLTRQEALRIAVHELMGHVLPRLNAQSAHLGLLRVGSAQSADDEEGRALVLEQRHGLLGHRRQVELGLRHLAALSVFDGADWVQTVRLMLQHGLELSGAVVIANRAHRGGGLGREVVYLSAFERVGQALQDEPELDGFMGSGRLSVDAAQRLARLPQRVFLRQSGRLRLLPNLNE